NSHVPCAPAHLPSLDADLHSGSPCVFVGSLWCRPPCDSTCRASMWRFRV
ncbi:hypothetical protein COCVIDRAFT_83627, partial [Bipolaris victoriae FI3]